MWFTAYNANEPNNEQAHKLTNLRYPILPTNNKMSAAKIIATVETEIDVVLAKLAAKYGETLAADFHAMWIHGNKAVVEKPSEAHQLFAKHLMEAAPAAEKPAEKKERARVVSKKMQEAFVALAIASGKTPEEGAELFEQAKKQYKDMPQAELDTLGGSFDSFAKSFLGIEEEKKEEKKEKKVKAKKEKAPTRIERWTPTLTRTLTKIVEETGGVMADDMKKQFHTWVDALTAEEFASCAMEGQMRKWVLTLRPVVEEAEKEPQAMEKKASGGAAGGSSEEEDEEELEEVEFEGETLMVGMKTGKVFRPSASGDIWVGNAGVGRFVSIAKPE